MLTITWHFLRSTKAIFVFAIIIFLYLFSHPEVHDSGKNASNILIYSSMPLTLIYAGILFLGMIINEHQQGSIFLLLASPRSRIDIFIGKLLGVIINLLVILLVQIFVFAYKNFETSVFLNELLPDTLPKVIYESLANALFFGGFWTIVGLLIRPALNRWMIVLVVLYSVLSGAYLVVAATIMPDENSLQINPIFSQILNIIYYQHFIFLADNPLQMASLFILGSILLYAAGAWLFQRRNFNST